MTHDPMCPHEAAVNDWRLSSSTGAGAAPPTPHGWVTWWPRPGGGSSTVYSHGPERPNYGHELNALLRIYPVFTAA